MVLPVLAGKGIETLRTGLSVPVIGKKVTTTYTDKKGRTTVEETSAQLRLWEAGAILIGGAVVAVLVVPDLLEDLGLKKEKIDIGPFGLLGSFEIKT